MLNRKVLSYILCLMLIIFNIASIAAANAETEVNETKPDVNDMLHTEGNLIKNSKGETVRLYGVNCPSLEWNPEGDNMPEAVIAAYDKWNSTLVRLPMNQDYWFGYHTSQNDGGAEYREMIRTIVDIAASRHKYILLELHWSNGGTEWGKYTGQHKMPDENSIVFWESVAEEFKNHPNVFFEPYNEPHDVSWSVWKDGGQVKETVEVTENYVQTNKTISYNAIGMQQLINTIRAKGANNIIVVSGLDWGFDLSNAASDEYKLTDTADGNGIVYDTHPYPWKNKNWSSIIDKAGEKYPILVGEFGIEPDKDDPNKPDDSQFKDYFDVLFDWMDSHQYSYTAWSFHTGAGPCIIKNWDYEPTPHHGAYVKAHLLKLSSQGVSFYTEKGYNGRKVNIVPGEYTSADLKQAGVEPEAIKSIKLDNDSNVSYRLTLYTEDSFAGDSFTFISNINDLPQLLENKKTASLKIETVTLDNINAGAKAESNIGNEQVNAVTDGNEKTKWMVDEVADKWIKTDLGSVYTVHRIVIKHSASRDLAAYHNNQDFKVIVSADGENWTEVYSVTGNKNYETVIDFEPIITQYVKVDITKGSQVTPGSRATVREIEVYGMKDIRAEKYLKDGQDNTENTPDSSQVNGNASDQGRPSKNMNIWIYWAVGIVVIIFAGIGFAVKMRKKA